MSKIRLTKRRNARRNSNTRRHSRLLKGGSLVLPSEYFGRDSGRYQSTNNESLSIENSLGKIQAVSQGTPNELGSVGPNLSPYQSAGGLMGNVVNFFTGKEDPKSEHEEENRYDVGVNVDRSEPNEERNVGVSQQREQQLPDNVRDIDQKLAELDKQISENERQLSRETQLPTEGEAQAQVQQQAGGRKQKKRQKRHKCRKNTNKGGSRRSLRKRKNRKKHSNKKRRSLRVKKKHSSYLE